MLFLNQADLLQCLDHSELQREMTRALISLSSQQAINFPRVVFPIKENGSPLGMMVARDDSNVLLGYKAITVVHDNREQQLNPHQGLVVLINQDTGIVQAVLDGCFITAVRTAAVSAVATDCLSRENASTMAVIGAGSQALEHIKAISKVRTIKRLRVFCRSKEGYEAFLSQLGAHSFNEIHFAQSPKIALNDADIVVTCTSSKSPLLSTDDLAPGCHINMIGACRPNELEVSLADRDHLKIYLDSSDACFAESDEIKSPLSSGALSPSRIIGEIGSLLSGTLAGRADDKDITVFKSVGLAIEDIFAANYFYSKAVENNMGQHIKW